MKKYKNMSFFYKIVFLCLLVSLIPTLLLGIFSFQLISNLLMDQEKNSITQTLQHETTNLDFKLNSYLEVMNLIAWDENINLALAKDYTNNFDMYITYRDVIDPAFDNICFIQKSITSITLYTDTPINPHGHYLQPISCLENDSWLNASHHKPFFDIDGKTKSAKLIYRTHNLFTKDLYYIVITLNYDTLFGSFDSLYTDEYGVSITDDSHGLVYANNFWCTLNQSALASNDYITIEDSTENAPYTVTLYRPIRAIIHSANKIAQPVILVLLLCVTAILPVSLYFSNSLVQPIKLLQKNMSDVSDVDTIKFTANYDSKDEIGQLFQSFEKMVIRLNYLVNEVLHSKIKQQEFEMKALQAQINPHFLYNSLSLINGKAILEEQYEISTMAQQISTFYRTTLNHGRSITTVKEELSNIKAYLNIQLMMHSYSFEVVYDIAADIQDFKMPNLILQPLIENAIEHGLDHKTNHDIGVISITCMLEKDLLVFEILDNGCGMPEEKCQNILSASSSGYGIQNVNERIQLTYGKSYGLTYKSTLGLGTNVTVRFPACGMLQALTCAQDKNTKDL